MNCGCVWLVATIAIYAVHSRDLSIGEKIERGAERDHGLSRVEVWLVKMRSHKSRVRSLPAAQLGITMTCIDGDW